MNEKEARLAVKELIDTNSATLLSGLTHFGQAREFVHLTTSAITPPTGYYFVAIYVINSRQTAMKIGTGNPSPIPQIFHNMEIAIVDYVDGEDGETELYENMDSDFQILGDRIVNLLKEQLFIVSSGGIKFRINRQEPTVTKTNRPVTWEDGDAFYAMLFADINFELEECAS